jgi:hypothetical protein
VGPRAGLDECGNLAPTVYLTVEYMFSFICVLKFYVWLTVFFTRNDGPSPGNLIFHARMQMDCSCCPTVSQGPLFTEQAIEAGFL